MAIVSATPVVFTVATMVSANATAPGPFRTPASERRSEQAGECDRERGLVGMALARRCEPLPRLAVAAQANQGHGLAETARDGVAGDRQHPPVVGQRLVHPRRPAVGVGQAQMRLGRLGSELGGGGIAGYRLRVPARPFEDGPDHVVGLGRLRVEPEGGLELDEGLASAPDPVEGHAEAELQVGVVGLQLEGEAELADGFLPVAVGVGLEGEGPMTLRTAKRVPELFQQGIGHGEPDPGREAPVDPPSAPVEVLAGLVEVAQAAVSQAQWVVHHGRGGVLAQDGLQVVGGGGVVADRRSGATELEPHHLGAPAADLGKRELDLRVVCIDGKVFRDHSLVVALGIDTEGRKHVLGLREGATETAAVASAARCTSSATCWAICPSGCTLRWARRCGMPGTWIPRTGRGGC